MSTVAEKLTAIADAIRTYAREPLGKLTLDDMAKNIPTIYNIGVEDGEPLGFEQGKKDAYDEFWDIFQQNGTRKNYIACFGTGWTPEIFKPKYPIKPVNAGYMFFNNMGEALVIPDFVEYSDNLAAEQGKTPQTHPDMFDENGHYKFLDFSECTYALYALPALKSNHFGTLDFSKCRTVDYLFYGHADIRGVKKIDKFISAEITSFNGAFQDATYLTDITMDGVVAKSINFGTCPLNANSVRSVISVLSPDVTGQTVTFKASSKALFSEADWTELITPVSNQYNGNWTVAIKA